MDNKDKLRSIFLEVLNIGAGIPETKWIYNQIPQWDSVGHMSLISHIEEGFDIMLETDDIIDFSSYDKGLKILSKYGINL